MTPQHTPEVQVQPDEDGWVVIVAGRRAVVVPTETDAVHIAEELSSWLRRESGRAAA
jgi:hypothetical protein